MTAEVRDRAPARGKKDSIDQNQPPSIRLPKGGGAIRGIGEKFSANPVTGTGSMSVPIFASPGRSGFGPKLALTYDSGAGNGSFGLGWSLDLPSISRKTDKGLPRYEDAVESDVFILSGAEDLVPETVDGVRHQDTDSVPGYTIHRYRPRVEGSFARIERWTRRNDRDVHWRAVTKDNLLTIYGIDDDSRIFDPEDRSRIFRWLISETRDDKGNAIVYGYKREDGAGVDPARICERHRGSPEDARRSVQRYLKRIRYGNRQPLLNADGARPHWVPAAQLQTVEWLFELVLDYGEHDADAPMPNDVGSWNYRSDPFSTYRGGFEVRTTRLCQRILMFHHFPNEAGVGSDCLVRSTDFDYVHEEDPADARNPIYSLLLSVTQRGYRREGTGYAVRSLPPVEFEYSRPVVQDIVEVVDPESLEGLPIGVDGARYRWTDLHGEGIPGILTEQAGGWFYKRNVTPLDGGRVALGSLQRVSERPNDALAAGARLMDLAGDGRLDVAVLDRLPAGLYEHSGDEEWLPFRPLGSRLTRSIDDPNTRLVDLTGDGLADVLITESEAVVWHRSLGEEGFAAAERVAMPHDEERGSCLLFADGTNSVFLADMSGDGLSDLVRVRNGNICYWPNLGYGRFGAKVPTDNSPFFDHPEQFDPARIRLADIDGSGTTDILYLREDGVRLYFNQSGNGWSDAQLLSACPPIDNATQIDVTDLLGNGTACLVWSCPLPGATRRPMRFVNLMGGVKPHLLIGIVNNLGAETRIDYAPSTKFYLRDKRNGTPWITRLPFPVHVVERVTTIDRVSHNRFVRRNAYHHGYFDGPDREFRGFGMVERWDSEELGILSGDTVLPTPANEDPASTVPPVHTKTWYHTGVFLGRDRVSRFFAGLLDSHDVGEYFREDNWTDAEAKERLLPDTTLPPHLTIEEEREACRALKGTMLRQEVYADDDSPRAHRPYTVIEQNFTVRCLQSRDENRHGVFFAHPVETLTFHYERNTSDPRVQHALMLQVDAFGNVLKEANIAYGRTVDDDSLPLVSDRDTQKRTLVTYTENDLTTTVDQLSAGTQAYRTPLPGETRSYELTGYTPTGAGGRFRAEDLVARDPIDPDDAVRLPVFDEEIDYETAPTGGRQRRLIECVRTQYRPDDLGASVGDPLALLPVRHMGARAVPGDSYKLAFTSGLLTQVFHRSLPDQPSEDLLPDPSGVLAIDASQGAYADRGGYVNLDGDGRWWMPVGRTFLSANPADTAADEKNQAEAHFFLPRRFRDPFGHDTCASYDSYDLLLVETVDPVGNRVTAGARDTSGNIAPDGNDYRVLQPRSVSDPNRNRMEVSFDALGMVVATAVMGKPEESDGDAIGNVAIDPTEPTVLAHLADPLGSDPHALLGTATTRLVYDLFAYRRTRTAAQPQPACVYTMARETHDADLDHAAGETTRIQHTFSYSDGFGREIQRKIQAEPESPGGPPRWVGTGWIVYNNKGKPVRKYEPFFSDTHRFEFDREVGVSPVLFYDPLDRVIATLHPNHTYEKVVFDPWQRTTFDVNDTVAPRGLQTGDPRTDPDIEGLVREYFEHVSENPSDPPWETWYEERRAGDLGPQEKAAADRSAAHSGTPTTEHFDSLGRAFLAVARNRVVCAGHELDGTEDAQATRTELDIEGNPRAVRDAIEQDGDARGRIIMLYDYDMLSAPIHQSSMEAGERWTLRDVAGNPIRTWDGRGHIVATTYDAARRSTSIVLTESGAAKTVETIGYGETATQAEASNLRGRIATQRDQAGVLIHIAYDFKGNLLETHRQLAEEYQGVRDWSGNVTLAQPAYVSSTRYDALNRPIQRVEPYDVAAGAALHVIQPAYNEANLLEKVHVWLEQAVAPTGLLDPATASLQVVTNIDYDAKGQRQRIDYGNGASTRYEYDEDTFRLIHLRSVRGAKDAADCAPSLNPRDCADPPDICARLATDCCVLQDLHYTYDPVGNITYIRDDAQQAVFFKNQCVQPAAAYTYDAAYRLIEATGREHLGQSGESIAHSYNDSMRVSFPHPGDSQAMGRYVERYVYDPVGNFRNMKHVGKTPGNPGWVRTYEYHEPSQIEPAKTSNRLTLTQIGGSKERYSAAGDGYDAHGNSLKMPQLQSMAWDHNDQLAVSQRQAVNLDDADGSAHHGERTYYVYDSTGQRVRKVTEKAGGGLKDERIYLGSVEVYRRHSGTNAGLVRNTLHVMDDKQRIALVELRTGGHGPAARQLVRFQYGNHLGSASLELDEQAQIISYEEYAPYGSTTYQAVRTDIEVPAKRYRYTGKERDEESGLYYHGARYYAPWIGRWTSPDPSGIREGSDVYVYCGDTPTKLIDPTGNAGTDPPHKLEKIKEGEPRKLSSAVVESFRKAASEIEKHTGVDIRLGIDDSTRNLSQKTSKVGASNYSWHKTGRAVDIDQDLRWVIVEETTGKKTKFRLYLEKKADSTEKGVKFKKGQKFHHCWYAKNQALKRTFIDVTAILEKHDWKRISAQKGWESDTGYNKREWWHYERRDGNSWYDALREIYTEKQLVVSLKKLTTDKAALKARGVPKSVLDKIFPPKKAKTGSP